MNKLKGWKHAVAFCWLLICLTFHQVIAAILALIILTTLLYTITKGGSNFETDDELVIFLGESVIILVATYLIFKYNISGYRFIYWICNK